MLNFNFKGNHPKIPSDEMDKSKFFHLSYYKKQILLCKDDVVTNKALVLLILCMIDW